MTTESDLSKLPREELEICCASLRDTALRLGEELNKVQTENGKLRAFVKDCSENLYQDLVTASPFRERAADLLAELAES
jgi:hypothetical protein